MRQRAAKEWEQAREKEKTDAAPSAGPEDRPRAKPTFAGFAKGALSSWLARVALALGDGG